MKTLIVIITIVVVNILCISRLPIGLNAQYSNNSKDTIPTSMQPVPQGPENGNGVGVPVPGTPGSTNGTTPGTLNGTNVPPNTVPVTPSTTTPDTTHMH